MTIWEQATTLQAWLPLFMYASKISRAQSDEERNGCIADAARWLSSQNKLAVDDELVNHLQQIIATKEGNAFVNWIVSKLEKA